MLLKWCNKDVNGYIVENIWVDCDSMMLVSRKLMSSLCAQALGFLGIPLLFCLLLFDLERKLQRRASVVAFSTSNTRATELHTPPDAVRRASAEAREPHFATTDKKKARAVERRDKKRWKAQLALEERSGKRRRALRALEFDGRVLVGRDE